MDPSITLRPIRDDDRAFLLKVYASTREDELAIVRWDAAEKEHFIRWQFEAQHKYYQENYPRAQFDIILAGECPVGRLYVDRREDEIRIVDIAILTEHRGAGIGGRLMRDLLAEADAAGLPVRIHVEKNNSAMRLYHRIGFTETGDTGVYLLMERTPRG